MRAVEDVGRHLTASQRALPDFVIIGAQKAGTTSLYHYLAQHPAVLGLERKEVHYFDNHAERPLTWYRAHFPTRAAMQRRARQHDGPVLTGEATPFYMFHPFGPARIASALPNVKLIAILREPVARAVSHYHHEVRGGAESLSLEEAIAQEPERLRRELDALGPAAFDDPRSLQRHASFLARGRYAEQMVRVFENVDRERVLVLFSEHLFARPDDVYARACSFLNLPPSPLRDVAPRNAGAYQHVNEAFAERLRGHFAAPNEILADLLGEDLPW